MIQVFELSSVDLLCNAIRELKSVKNLGIIGTL